MSSPVARENATSRQRGPLAHIPPQSPVQANTAYSAIALHPPTSARAASTAPNPAAACRRSRFAASEPMPIAKTITDSTTEVWATESPIKYAASATSSSSYTSPHAAQTNTPARTSHRPVRCRTGSGTALPALPGPPGPAGSPGSPVRGPSGPSQVCVEPGGTGACRSITPGTLRHALIAQRHPHA